MIEQTKLHSKYRWWLNHSYITFKIKIMPSFIINWLIKKSSDTAQY